MSVLDSSLADKPLQLSKTVRRWRGLTSAAPFHAGPLHFNSSALSRADSSMPDGRRISPVSIQSWDQPNSRSSGGCFPLELPGVGGMWGHVKCPEPRHEFPCHQPEPQRTHAFCWPLTLGPSPSPIRRGPVRHLHSRRRRRAPQQHTTLTLPRHSFGEDG